MPAEADREDAGRYFVELIGLQESGAAFSANAPRSILELVSGRGAKERIVWMGRDDKTGPLAIKLRAATAGSRAVLIHHMAHGAYQPPKKGSSAAAKEKKDAQRALFGGADLCFAVGPMLRDQLAGSIRVRLNVTVAGRTSAARC